MSEAVRKDMDLKITIGRQYLNIGSFYNEEASLNVSLL